MLKTTNIESRSFEFCLSIFFSRDKNCYLLHSKSAEIANNGAKKITIIQQRSQSLTKITRKKSENHALKTNEGKNRKHLVEHIPFGLWIERTKNICVTGLWRSCVCGLNSIPFSSFHCCSHLSLRHVPSSVLKDLSEQISEFLVLVYYYFWGQFLFLSSFLWFSWVSCWSIPCIEYSTTMLCILEYSKRHYNNGTSIHCVWSTGNCENESDQSVRGHRQ